mgnify:FL=1
MRPIIFARVADMKYYKGITETDKPENGGSYVHDTGLAHECYNFDPIVEDGEDFEKCLGYCRMAGGKNGVNQLHIEKIVGCEVCKKEEICEGVIVVFVSKSSRAKNMRVVGFYKNATVYRYPHFMQFESGYEQEYWFEAKKEDCVLLPYSTRFSSSDWYVPNSTASDEYGFGRSQIWYAAGKGASEKEIEYVEKMIKSIDEYVGENWMEKEVM